MSRFRLFGRPSSGPPPYPAPAYGTPPPLPSAWPAQAAAPAAPVWPATADPPTDPYGFPPVAALEPVPLHASTTTAFPTTPPAFPSTPPVPPGYPSPPPVAPPVASSVPAPVAVPSSAPDPAEASALAGAFAADYLSWDEDDPARRGRVLLDYLAAPGNDPARLGWSGHGRQRAEFALPGLVRADGDGRVLVDVRVRVTPYRSVGDHGSAAEPEPEVAGTPAVAPAPTGRGWRSLASYWIRISVPVATEGGRLVVDLEEETLGEGPPAAVAGTPADDHSLADDDPIGAPPVPPAPTGGAW